MKKTMQKVKMQKPKKMKLDVEVDGIKPKKKSKPIVKKLNGSMYLNEGGG